MPELTLNPNLKLASAVAGQNLYAETVAKFLPRCGSDVSHSSRLEPQLKAAQPHLAVVVDWAAYVLQRPDFQDRELIFVGGGCEKAYIAARMLANQSGRKAQNIHLVDFPRALFNTSVVEFLSPYLRQRGLTSSSRVVLLDDGGFGSAFPYLGRALFSALFSLRPTTLANEHLMCSLCDLEGFNRIVGEEGGKGFVGRAVAYINNDSARHRAILGYRQDGARVVADYFNYRKLRPVFRGEVSHERIYFSEYAAPYLRYLDLYEPDRVWAGLDAYELYLRLQGKYLESVFFDAEVDLLRKLIRFL